jgi:hypothetical protein
MHDIYPCYCSRSANRTLSTARVPIPAAASGCRIFQDTGRARELKKSFYFQRLPARSPEISPRKKYFWTAPLPGTVCVRQ